MCLEEDFCLMLATAPFHINELFNTQQGFEKQYIQRFYLTLPPNV